MSSTSRLTDLLRNNQIYSQTHESIQPNAQIMATSSTAYKTFVISCTDGRISPEKFLNITKPEEFLIARNSGGRARPVLANLVALDDLVGIEDVLVIGHTDCGARSFNEQKIRNQLKERAPGNEDFVESIDFGKITGSVEDSVRDDVEFLKQSPLVREDLKDRIHGLVFDIETGKLNRIV